MPFHLSGRVGAALFAVLALVALAGPSLAPYDPDQLVTSPFARPSLAHPLGANDIGQDLLSQLIAGTRTSLAVGVSAGVLATALGAVAGLGSGLAGGAADFLVMRLVDILLALPYLPLMIVLAVFLGPRAETQVLVMAAIMWPRTARVLRAQVLSVAGRGHVQTARVMGAGMAHLLLRHIGPLVFPLIVPELVRTAGGAVMTETSLAFLGLGDPVHRSWGSILFYANARAAFLTDAWMWWVVPPGLGVGLTVLSLGLIGFGLEERARPRLRASAFAGRVAAHARLAARARAERTERGRVETATGGSAAQAVALSDRGAIPHRSEQLLSIENLAVTYPTAGRAIAGSDAAAGVAALRGVTLSIRAGETVGLVGESGSGKTTLATAILALPGPAARLVTGRILLAGRDVLTADTAVVRELRGTEAALVPQNSMNALNPVYRALDQVAEAIEAHAGRRWGRRQLRREARRRAGALLAEVGLPADRWRCYPSELSGGMRQRVVLAIALANNPRLLIADEPTSGLDLLLQAELVALLRRLRERSNMGVLLVSHDLGLAAAVADRLAVMQAGRVVEDGITSQVVDEPAHPHSLELLTSVARTTRALSEPGRASAVNRPSAPDVVRVNRVTVTFRTGRRHQVFDAVQDVSFSVAEGEWVALTGPSGAGKSTLARAIVGLLRPGSGDVRLQDLRAAHKHAAGGPAPPAFHLVLQDPYDALPPGMRVADVVAEPLRINRVRRSTWGALIERVLEDVLLSPGPEYARRYPHELSGGERQRVALARALVLPPRLLVADEPTSLLDASHRLELLDLMRQLTDAAGVACLHITHDIALAAAFADRLLVLDRGRLVESGRPADVVSAPRHPITAALVAAARRGTDFGPAG